MDKQKKSEYNRRYREKQKNILLQGKEKEKIEKKDTPSDSKKDDTSPQSEQTRSFLSKYGQYIVPIIIPIARSAFFFLSQSLKKSDTPQQIDPLDPGLRITNGQEYSRL